MDERSIIDLFVDRDERAIAEVQAEYGAYVKAIAFNVLGDAGTAEECVNDALLAAWDCVHRTKPDSLKAYLAKLVRNNALNRLAASTADKRGGGAAESALTELNAVVAGFGDPWAKLDEKALISELNDFLSKLPKRKRDLFVSRYWYFDDIGVIAERTGRSRNSVSVELARLREKLRKHLKAKGINV